MDLLGWRVMTASEYQFDKQMRASDGVCESKNVSDILLANIPGSLNVYRAHEKNDRNGTD